MPEAYVCVFISLRVWTVVVFYSLVPFYSSYSVIVRFKLILAIVILLLFSLLLGCVFDFLFCFLML